MRRLQKHDFKGLPRFIGWEREAALFMVAVKDDEKLKIGKKLLDKISLVIYHFWSQTEKRRFIMWNSGIVLSKFS